MAILALFLMGTGYLISFVGGLWLLIKAFQENKLWGILVLFVPFASVVFILLHWDEAKKPTLCSLGGLAVVFMGAFVAGWSGASESEGALPIRQAAIPSAITQPEPAPEAKPTPTSPIPVTPPPPVEPEAAPVRPVPLPKPLRTKPANTNTLASVPVAAAAPSNTESVESRLPVDKPIESPAPAPVTIEFLSLFKPQPEAMREIKLRISNSADKPVRRVKMTLIYLGPDGRKIKEWTTIHQEEGPLVGKNTTANFDCPAFNIPDLAVSVSVTLQEVTFQDGTVWKSAR